MQENRLLLWTKGKFKLIASSRMATCCHPTPEGMGIRAGHSITKKRSPIHHGRATKKIIKNLTNNTKNIIKN